MTPSLLLGQNPQILLFFFERVPNSNIRGCRESIYLIFDSFYFKKIEVNFHVFLERASPAFLST